jgi:hypothetical protein
MSDAEFWDHVFAWQHENDEWYWHAFDIDIYAIECARCGCTVEVDDPENRERDAFCDECADETVEVEQPAWEIAA